MKIFFKIPYRMDRGRQMAVVGSLPLLGMGEASCGLKLDFDPGLGIWSGWVTLAPDVMISFDYRYVIVNDNMQILDEEGGKARLCEPREFSDREIIELMDYWRPPASPDDIFDTAPFREVIFKRRPFTDPPDLLSVPFLPGYAAAMNEGECKLPFLETRTDRKNSCIRMRVPAACVPPGQRVYLTGENQAFGAWDAEKAIPMYPGSYPFWEADIPVQDLTARFSYKYAVGEVSQGHITWETGEDRLFPQNITGKPEEGKVTIMTDWPLRNPGGPWKGCGIAVPVFSLRSERGLGTGEFTDIKLLVDWVKQMDMQMIQVLPVNDTSAYGTWYDSYPYSVISVFALHPLYLNLSALAVSHPALSRDIAAKAEQLNECKTLDYEAVMDIKTALLKRLFHADADHIFASASFQSFFREHAFWLRPYAAFRYLRDRYKTNDHRYWGEDSFGSPEVIARLTDPEASHYPDIAFHYYVQFHLYEQLADAAAYARGNGIILKGDIPIGVAKGSVETWLHPQWFHMNRSAGAPPDDFSEEGQNWGFPLYNWESMATDHYSWWKKRLHHLHRFFDAVRMDHVIGFFRIWAIPDEASHALLGRFYPALPLTGEELEKSGLDDIERLCEPGSTEDDVIFIPDHPGDRTRLHPRILLEKTSAFASLNRETQNILRRFYEDYYYRRQEDFWRLSGWEKLSALRNATEMLICGRISGWCPSASRTFWSD